MNDTADAVILLAALSDAAAGSFSRLAVRLPAELQVGAGDWSVNVKAEIDLDDKNGDDRCVLNDQQIIRESAGLKAAIDRAAALVSSYPTKDLLTAGWEPADWYDEEL